MPAQPAHLLLSTTLMQAGRTNSSGQAGANAEAEGGGYYSGDDEGSDGEEWLEATAWGTGHDQPGEDGGEAEEPEY